MENLNDTDKTSDNAEKELRISDVIGSDNHTRFYIPTDKKKTN